MVIGKSVGQAVGTTTTTALVSNSNASGKLVEVVAVYVSNVDGTNNALVTLWHNIGGTAFKITDARPIAVNETDVLVEMKAPIYIEEGDEIGIYASAPSDAEVVAYYREIS